ncbi:MAG TPA: hypothetical protein VFN55_08025 [Solirubrobacteraceae bacterium]|nr:hypothetical protein [Solirubrobacteraceae bacterium]
MRTRSRATSRDLALAITCLPRHTREAMLAGIAGNDIIVGAYATGDGICPMLAAHRHGGRTNFIGFANAWDRFAFRNGRSRRARRATERELRVLRAHLEASLLDEDAPHGDLAAARREHEQLLAARREHEQRLAGRREQEQRLAARAQRDPEAGRDHDLAAAKTPVAPSPRRGRSRDDRPQDADRRRELDNRPGWAWTRLVRRYDDYERLLAHVQAQSAAASPASGAVAEPGPRPLTPA